MEFFTHELGLLEELLASRETEYFPNQDLTTAINSNSFANDISSIPTNINPFGNYTLPIDDTLINCSFHVPLGDDLSTADSFNANLEMSQPFPGWQENYCSMFLCGEDEAPFGNGLLNFETGAPFKVEPVADMPTFDTGFCPVPEKRSKFVKKVNGNQSKNLMAERRRRKRLNDRLSMLRSVVPKISKMDRTSILGDTIDYMNELLHRINNLQEEMHLESNQMSSISIFKDVKPREVLVRNSPKFDVERRINGETAIEICCAAKPGLLLSTVSTLEAGLGLQIQHCVISCFNDFAAQTSCSCSHLDMKLDSEDIKQALIKNAGYAANCL